MTYQIDTHIPVPSTEELYERNVCNSRKRPVIPLSLLKVGDSVFVPETEGATTKARRHGWLRNTIYKFRNANPAITLATAVATENGIRGRRIWRTE